MKMRRLLWILAFILPVSVLPAQENPAGGEAVAAQAADGIFPLYLVLDGAEFAAGGCGAWRPDWPPELPPDAFRTPSGKVSAEISAVSGEGAGFSLDYRFYSLPAGSADGSVKHVRRMEEFPFMLNGRMTRVSIVYGGLLEIREMVLAFPSAEKKEGEAAGKEESAEGSSAEEPSGGESWKLEFLEYRDTFPALVRASCGDLWYFIYLSRNGREVIETWYDEEGKARGAYSFSLTAIDKDMRIRAYRNLRTNGETEYFYDSRGFITESSGPGGVFKVQYYREDLPRYWERRPAGDSGESYDTGCAGKYSLQWDENGFLVRITGAAETPSSAAGDELVDYRYEYSLDEKGNWTERREIRMIRSMGLLVPSPGTVFRRALEYGR